MKPPCTLTAVAAVAVALLACGHVDRPPREPTAGSGSAAGGARGGPCDAVRGRVEQLYRAEATAHELARPIADA
ncbi:MAG TPA: hypothetical protein VGD80_26220, partial [Kofleriaceae bacterium]